MAAGAVPRPFHLQARVISFCNTRTDSDFFDWQQFDQVQDFPGASPVLRPLYANAIVLIEL